MDHYSEIYSECQINIVSFFISLFSLLFIHFIIISDCLDLFKKWVNISTSERFFNGSGHTQALDITFNLLRTVVYWKHFILDAVSSTRLMTYIIS